MAEHTRWWFEMLGHWSLAWATIVALVSTWLLCCHPRRATVRYAGWLFATFAGLALLPAILELAPRSSWRDLLALLKARSVATPSTTEGTAFPSWFESISSRPVARPVAEPEPSILVTETARAVAPFNIQAPGIPQPTQPWDHAILAAFILWFSGVLVFVARLAMAAVQVGGLMIGSSIRDGEDLTVEAQAIAAALGMRRRPRVLIHPQITTPICVGLIRPAIVWPSNANCPMTPDQRRAALTHEVAHLRHGDDWIALLAELWRALTWFFLPVHWTVSRLRLERECRCDDLAAAEMADPKTYARWLLDLTPVHLGSPLAASLSGASGITARVRRLILGQPGNTRPLKRRQLITMTLLGILLLSAASSVRLIGTVQAETPADAPLPEITPKELASRIRAAWAGYDKGLFEVSFKTTDNTNGTVTSKPGKPDAAGPMLVHYQGRFRFLSDGRRWRVEYDSMMPTMSTKKLNPDRWSSGFDGKQLYDWNVTTNLVTLGQSHIGAENWKPSYQFWKRDADFVDALEQPTVAPSAIVISQRVIDGFRCYVIARSYPRFHTRTEEIVSPRQNHLLLRATHFRNDKPYHIQTLSDVRELQPGLWAPGRLSDESRVIRDDGSDQLMSRTTMRVERFEPAKTVDDDTFHFEPPYGADVTDPRLGISYRNDHWWPEAGKLLRDQFDWPKVDLQPLQDLASTAKPEGKPAPPITAAAWINSEPIDLARLKGKVVLIEFWNSDNAFLRGRIAALRSLYQTYHPMGLEMISIHVPTNDVQKLRDFAHEFGMTQPIAIDTRVRDDGVTALAYDAGRQPYAFLVDHQGIVHPVTQAAINGQIFIMALVDLLQKAGYKDVPTLSLETPRLSNEMQNIVLRKLHTWIRSAPAGGVIRGRVVDGQGQPLVGASITGELTIHTLLFPFPGAYQLMYTGFRFNRTTDADGRFEVERLTKGEYELKIAAPARASQVRKIGIGPDFKPVEFDVILDQGDSITGVVRDASGQPIAGASVFPEAWYSRSPEDGDGITRPAGPDTVTTDAEGRYRIGSLRQGRYNLEISAPRHKKQMLEAVPAGTQNADATLE
jgi:beta-lactamase regulating signal transducer with metallopeptidase domain